MCNINQSFHFYMGSIITGTSRKIIHANCCIPIKWEVTYSLTQRKLREGAAYHLLFVMSFVYSGDSEKNTKDSELKTVNITPIRFAGVHLTVILSAGNLRLKLLKELISEAKIYIMKTIKI